MAEHVILFAGPMGAGKTTAIGSLSDIDVVSTEALSSDHSIEGKLTTTVALDYGEISISPGEKIRLYGVPGQKRFEFMWAILQKRAFGLMLLVNADAPNLTEEVRAQLETFSEVVDRGGVVVGITRSDVHAVNVTQAVQQVVNDAFPGRATPVFEIDARDAAQMRIMLMTLIADIETREGMKGRG